MASIVKRRNKYSVVYYVTDKDGNKTQKWETFESNTEARKRKTEIEFHQENGTFIVPTATTVDELINEYFKVYGVNKWALSTYDSRVSLYNNYIKPFLGDMKVKDISTRTINNFYSKLLTVPAVSSKTRKAQTECVTPSRVKEVHKLLRTAFKQAVIWEMIGKNPCDNAILPACKQSKREIWDVPTLQKAMEVCDDDVLRLAIHMSFAASLRMGEMLGLTLDCIDVSDKAIEENRAYIYIEKELQRVRRGALEALSEKDVIYKFPACIRSTHTVLVLKTPKTETSVRKVFLPKTVAYMVQERIKEIEEWKELFGDEFTDYNLLFCNTLGRPIESSVIERAMAKLIRENDLPEVVFHSLRHTSITAKLRYNGGDIKSVQGDSGHARAEMVTDVYSHILDENRQANASRLDTMFYGNEPVKTEQEEDPMVQITKLLSNPATAELLKQLAKTIV